MELEVEGERLGIHSGQRNRRGQAPLLRGGHVPRHRGGLRPHQRVGRGPRLRGVGECGRGQDHRPRHRQQQQRVSNEIRAMVVDYVINHGMTMRAAATMFQPNLRRSSVASIIRTFCNENRIEIRPNRGGRSKILTDQQEQAVVNMVRAGFNLAKTRRRGRNLIGQRATVEVPGQHGANITMCAAISEDGVVGRRPCVGSYNAALIITFLDELNQVCRADGVTYVIVWDNVQFHHSRMVQAWFQAHPQFLALHLPSYSPFLNPVEEFFSTWRWKVYDRHPHEQVTLLQAMDDACNDITADQCQAWIHHARRFFPRCLANENIHCDVDENLWPNP
ncbi:Insertion element IS630 uncharacterized 39 kDa protein [Labeo rohita]|uniref:Insertion element IS630 uncharacterized 39 kDa protein n=1 Tax=Labeo rohita TaxID=84645 RepID=A0ABQ8MX33_LABRO|nr:Insertion element IS630 uncharacterized 39 kDa protein [Labeo rohita]